MKNTIVVKNLTLRMVLATREISDILQKQCELPKENANSIAKIIIEKVNNLVRTEENPRDVLTELLAR